MEKTVVIIGAGPAGLTAAYKLLKETEYKPVILEESGEIGGISRTVYHNGNRMDIGGHLLLQGRIRHGFLEGAYAYSGCARQGR